MEILIIISLYLKPLSASMPCFMATNSAPKTVISSVDCFFENHCNNMAFTFIKKSLLYLQDNMSPA